MGAQTGGVGATLTLKRASDDRVGAQELRLVLQNTAAAGRSFPVDKDELRIGKSAENDVVLEHQTVSRTHLVLLRRSDRLLVRDLGSTNGTFVDGSRIHEAYLKPGARLEVGEVELLLQPQVAPLSIAPDASHRLGGLIGQGVGMRKIFALLKRIAPRESTVLLQGETGSGKGAMAKLIHALSPRRAGPLVVFDCASVSETLIESELFGHEKGAFTGAVAGRVGCLERANGGTLFLDEVDDLALDLQPKLLRAIEEREFHRLGSSAGPVPFDARIVAATKKDLWAEVHAGRFREDLYFRLSVFTVDLPPLRERREDLPVLADSFGEPVWERLTPAMREQFLAHTWPGNVRELRNAVERVRHLAEIPELAGESFFREYPVATAGVPAGMLPARFDSDFKSCKEELVRRFEREYLSRLLVRHEGNLARCAREAGIDRKHLYSLLNKHGLDAADPE